MPVYCGRDSPETWHTQSGECVGNASSNGSLHLFPDFAFSRGDAQGAMECTAPYSPKIIVLSTLPDNVTLLNYLIKQEDDWDFIVDMVIIYVELRWIECLESLDKLKVCMKNIDRSFSITLSRQLQHAGWKARPLLYIMFASLHHCMGWVGWISPVCPLKLQIYRL